MADSPQKIAKLNALRLVYGEGLPQRVEALTQAWYALGEGATWTAAHAELLHLAHSLAGSAGTFGYKRVSELAKQLEEVFSATPSLPFNAEICAVVQERLRQLWAAAQTQVLESTEPILAADLTPCSDRTSPLPTLLGLVEDDPCQAQDLAAQLNLLGWTVRIYPDASSVMAALPLVQHVALIVDVVLPEGRLSGVTLLREVQACCPVPCVMISARWDWESRLAAVQAGAMAYFAKPLDVAALDEQLERITQSGDAAPYRVLVMDDDQMLAEHYAHSLNLAGMEAVVVQEASQLLDMLAEYQTELVLMDIHMPRCSGIEVARVIRQDPQYFSLPIVFLTTESGFDRQQQAMQAGADDFLRKPISDAELIFAVSVRAERFRTLTKLVRQDSMTGLYNHLSFKLRLEAEIDRSHRTNKPLSMAMLDIDHFKDINDTYGHPQGDRVIRTLAHLLRKRLRKTDIIGRYGGEEFAVVMPDTPAELAHSIVDELRTQFAQLRYATAHGEFVCAFSAGVATYQPLSAMDHLIAAADQALYQAKHDGRNCVRTLLGNFE